MLAVVEVSERRLAGLRVGEPAEVKLITGETASGKIRFVAKTASQTTRTYRVEVELRQPRRRDSGRHHRRGRHSGRRRRRRRACRARRSPSRRPATSACARSAQDGTVAFNRVTIVEDEQSYMWVAGLRDGARVIVQGQDFVREGQTVEAVAAAEVTATVK